MRRLLIPLLYLLSSVFPLLSQNSATDATDVQRLGLKGKVETFAEESASYVEYEGDWIQQTAFPAREMVFNERGYKTEERTYQSGSSREQRRITYLYDEAAALIERSEY